MCLWGYCIFAGSQTVITDLYVFVALHFLTSWGPGSSLSMTRLTSMELANGNYQSLQLPANYVCKMERRAFAVSHCGFSCVCMEASFRFQSAINEDAFWRGRKSSLALQHWRWSHTDRKYADLLICFKTQEHFCKVTNHVWRSKMKFSFL